MWQLELGCELIDMNKGFIGARFYNQKDYLKGIRGRALDGYGKLPNVLSGVQTSHLFTRSTPPHWCG